MGTSSGRRWGWPRSWSSRSWKVSPGRNPLVIRLSSAPATNTTSAPRRRSRSARSAQSANSDSSSPVVSSSGYGENQPLRVAAHDADGVGVQVVADDAQLPPDDLGVERLAGASPAADEAGVVADAVRAHACTFLSYTVLTVPYKGYSTALSRATGVRYVP